MGQCCSNHDWSGHEEMDIPASSQVPNPASSSSSEERALVDHGATGGAAEASLGAAAGSTSLGSASASETATNLPSPLIDYIRPSFHAMDSIIVLTKEALQATIVDDDNSLNALHAALDSIADGTKTPADEDYKYWGGDPQPWREGTSNDPVTDPTVIAREEEHKRAAEAEDFPAAAGAPTDAHADKLRALGIRIDFLLYLTFAFNLWEWKTWEVVQFLVKPATE